MHSKYLKSWNAVGFSNNILVEMLLEDQILQIRGNNLLVARCGSQLQVARCHGRELNVNHH